MKSIAVLLSVQLVASPAHRDGAESDEPHVVSRDELRAALQARFAERAGNIEAVSRLLEHDEVRRHVGSLVDLEAVREGLPALDDETLQALAARSRAVDDSLRGEGSTRTVAIVILVVLAILAIAYAVLVVSLDGRGS